MTSNDCQNGRVCENIAAPNRPTVLTCLPPPDAGPDAGVELPDSSPEAGGGLADAAAG